MLQQSKEPRNNVDSDIDINNINSEENKIFSNKNNIVHNQRRHRKRRKGHFKKHEASNCGTKEPKRPTETHIEWQPQGKVSRLQYSLFITLLVIAPQNSYRIIIYDYVFLPH